MRTDKEGYTTEEERKGASRGRDERGTRMEESVREWEKNGAERVRGGQKLNYREGVEDNMNETQETKWGRGGGGKIRYR